MRRSAMIAGSAMRYAGAPRTWKKFQKRNDNIA
jgi:hypothetical protein